MNMVSPHGQKLFDTSFLDFVNHWCCSGVVSGKVCKLIPGVSSLKIGYVNEHGQPPWTKLFWHFMFGLCESFGLFLG